MLTLPYGLQSACSDGQRRTFAHVVCGQCDAYQDHALTGRHNPELVVKHMRRLGWTVDFGPSRHNRCPACTADKSKRHDKVIPMTTTKAVPPAAVVAIAARDLTPDEKAAVRRLLDANFDDAKGLYLDGYSDRRIGDECKVPAACVTRLRELAYGPIRTDPEIELLRGAIDSLKGDAVKLSANAEKLSSDADTCLRLVHALEARLKGVEARVAGKAA